jgi:hypothetical protein
MPSRMPTQPIDSISQLSESPDFRKGISPPSAYTPWTPPSCVCQCGWSEQNALRSRDLLISPHQKPTQKVVLFSSIFSVWARASVRELGFSFTWKRASVKRLRVRELKVYRASRRWKVFIGLKPARLLCFLFPPSPPRIHKTLMMILHATCAPYAEYGVKDHSEM